MKRPRYYCEHCHAEVRKDARVCPSCGRFFSSVKCPRCSYVGKADDFSFGCPVCGYADPANAPPEPFTAPPVPAPALPWWIYPAVAVVLFGLVLLLLDVLR